MISAKVICDSVNPAGDRITTGLMTYPRWIHCELMTHRMLAKNAASSRAIPVEKMIAAVRENPAMFEQYGAANKGMQAQESMPDELRGQFMEDWTKVGQQCAFFAELWKGSAAKQMVNRALEPWAHMTIIITGTDWHNFFALRAHPDAQPEFQVLAYRWLDAYLKSEPVKMGWGDWHLPMIPPTEELKVDTGKQWDELARKISVARCARVSYTRHDQVKSVEDDIALHDRMAASSHWSPFEHQAISVEADHYFGCYHGWRPYRKYFTNENRTSVDLHALLAAKPDWINIP